MQILPGKLIVMKKNLWAFLGILSLLLPNYSKSKGNSSNENTNNLSQSSSSTDTIISWLTKADATVLLQKQNAIAFNGISNSYSTITVGDSKTFQSIDGFGYALTGG